jgi:single-stranded-DNA-specific exonuclease
MQMRPHAADPAATFTDWLDRLAPPPVLVLCHDDADGLSAGLLLAEALARAGRLARIRIVGRGEDPWSAELRAEAEGAGGLILADLGIRAELLCPDVRVLFVDHHVPRGLADGAWIVTGYGLEPQPSSSLLAFRAASSVASMDDRLWLAALGLVGDMAENDAFPEMAEARRRHGITALRRAAALVNQPRRSPSGDACPALDLLRKADGPKAVLSGEHPETAILLAARDAVRAELEAARRTAPTFAGDVALFRFASPAKVHPLVAQTWAGRLRGKIVLAANTGFRAGWVHFAARSAEPIDLVAFLDAHAPPGAGGLYGGGHARASGGALELPDWNRFVRGLGFGSEMEVA